jgi:XTP/dITP diphosphohydrolase
VVLATHNAGKIAEMRVPLEGAGLVVTDAAALGLVAPEETGADFRANAALKALAAARAAGMAALADDSGFEVAALGGAPGVVSARWVAEAGSALGAMTRVWAEASGDADRGAGFTCVLALGWPDGEVGFFEGRVRGEWVWPPRGDGGFGYDPMFVPEGSAKTFGEMPAGEKERISHRARALAAFLAGGVA